ncbi:MAG: hypothetical protein ACHQJ6_01510 [Candidatus Berkiellales bacterium]
MKTAIDKYVKDLTPHRKRISLIISFFVTCLLISPLMKLYLGLLVPVLALSAIFTAYNFFKAFNETTKTDEIFKKLENTDLTEAEINQYKSKIKQNNMTWYILLFLLFIIFGGMGALLPPFTIPLIIPLKMLPLLVNSVFIALASVITPLTYYSLYNHDINRVVKNAEYNNALSHEEKAISQLKKKCSTFTPLLDKLDKLINSSFVRTNDEGRPYIDDDEEEKFHGPTARWVPIGGGILTGYHGQGYWRPLPNKLITLKWVHEQLEDIASTKKKERAEVAQDIEKDLDAIEMDERGNHLRKKLGRSYQEW